MEEAGFILSDVDRAPGESAHCRELVVQLKSANAKFTLPHAEKKAQASEGLPPVIVGTALYVQIWKKRGTKTVFEPNESFALAKMPLPKRYFIAKIDKKGKVTIEPPKLAASIEPVASTISTEPSTGVVALPKVVNGS